jgi:hypothetical protein
MTTAAKPVYGPRGNVIAPYDLPPARGAHWTAYRKADLIAAISGGLLTLDEAKARYALTDEELSEWRNGVAKLGLVGLRTRRNRPSPISATTEPSKSLDGGR